MVEETKESAAREAAMVDPAKPAKKKRKYTRRAKVAVGRPKGSGKRGRPKGSKNKPKGKVGRPKKVATEGVKRGPGRPKGSGKGKPGRPKGSGKKRGPKPGRKAVVVPKGFIKKAEAKRLVKAAVANLKATLPRVIRKELLKLLK
jgi:hypothetical protein